MHVPTLPSLPTWETPIAASREIVEAISDAADSAVDAATSAVRSARRRRSGRRVLRVSWRYVAAAAFVLAAVVAIRRRRSSASSTTPTSSAVDPEGVGRSGPARDDGRIQEYGDDLLAEAGARHTGTTIAD